MIAQNKNITYQMFLDHCKEIERSSIVIADESPSVKAARIKRALKDYAFFFEYYFPLYAKSKCASFHVKAANAIKDDQQFRGILEWFRGAAKSVHADIGYPLWLKINGELKCMLLVGETDDKAKRLLASVQAQLSSNRRFIHDFGEQFSFGDWSGGEFSTKDGTAFFALGLGQSPRGTRKDENRPDYIVCDDVDTKKRSNNPRLVKEAIEWIEDDLMGTFDVGRQRFVLVNNRISKNSILAGLADKKVTKRSKLNRWFHLQVNALDKSGKPTWPEKYTVQYWKDVKADSGLRTWEKEYMNNPIEEGTVFKNAWIRWKKILPLHQYESIVAYCDPSFKNNANSDYKAIRVWGKRGTELHLIDAFVRQTSVAAMVSWFYDLHESLPEGVICEYYIEANFLQDLLLDEFYEEGAQRGYQLPIRPDKRAKPDKYSRIESTSPLYERGFIHYNIEKKDDADFQRGIDQLLAIEPGGHSPDDSPDADEGALWILQRHGRQRAATVLIGPREHRSIY